MSKRKRFIIATILLFVGFLFIQFGQNINRFIFIGILSGLSLILFLWALWEGLGKNMTLLTLVLPVYFTACVGIFWFLLPTNILARTPVMLIYALGIYVLFLTMNIYTVSSVRTIALFRAARGVGFVLTLVTTFLLYNTILSIHNAFYIQSIIIFLSSILLFWQGYWSVNVEHLFNKKLLFASLISSLIVAEVSVALFFWPVTVIVGSLFLTVCSYVLLGLGQAYFEERLFATTYKEHLLVAIFVFILIFFATHWG